MSSSSPYDEFPQPRKPPAGFDAARFRGSARQMVLLLGAIVLVTFLAFSPSMYQGWMRGWDDDWNFLWNESYRGLGWENVKWAFTTYHHGPYQPLSWLSLGLDYELWRMNPRGYHFTNLMLHLANALLAFVFFRALLRRAVDPGKVDESRLRVAAAGAALLFAVHPLRVESVVWITERRDVLSGVFFLTTLILYLAATDERVGRSWRRVAYVGVVVAFTASLLSKATGMTLPVALLVLDAFPLRRIRFEGWRPIAAREVWLEKLPLLAISAWIAWHAWRGQQAAGTFVDVWQPLPRATQALYGLCFYPWKTLVPLGLVPVYELAVIDLLAPRFLLTSATAIAVTVLLVRQRARWPALLAAWAAFAILAAPVLGLTQAGVQIAADRYTYLPCLPFAALGAVALCRWRIPGWIALVLVLVLAVLTFRQTRRWNDPRTLFTYAVETQPDNGQARYYLGGLLFDKYRYEQAEPHLRFYLEHYPDDAETWNRLGITRERQGDVREAIDCYERALEIAPDITGVRENLDAARRTLQPR